MRKRAAWRTSPFLRWPPTSNRTLHQGPLDAPTHSGIVTIEVDGQPSDEYIWRKNRAAVHNATRADLGALANRLESTVNNLSQTKNNIADAESRIMDADFAAETAQLSKSQIIQQASVSVLAQANAAPQVALSLI